ncbi:MAG: valine--tRNA ligase [Nitrososphaerales archaeon]
METAGVQKKEGPFEGQKSWDKAMEAPLLSFWDSIDISGFDPASKRPIFVIDTPPPYPSGKLHVGSASHYALIDMVARTARMLGHEVLFPLGIDRNGLPVELFTEKKYGVSIRTTPREKFLELCSTALDDLEAEMVQTFKTMGLSADFANKYRTDAESYRVLTQATFIEQWNKGRIYIGTRPTNYCVDCGTTIADAEIEYKEIPTKLVYFNFKIPGDPEAQIPIASTRPELICTCQAVIVNPEDARYKTLVGKKAKLPFYSRSVPIIMHNSAKPEFGTGAAMICSYGDYNDAMLFRELSLQEIIAIGLDGRMKPVAGEELAGLTVKAARKAMIEKLQHASLVSKIEEIAHRTPMCERSKTPIEIIPLEEYYLKVVDIKDTLKELAHEIRFHPEMHRIILLNWLEVALDWPITRRRFYGTEVPVWYCSKCKTPFVPQPGVYYRPWKEPPPGSPRCEKCGSGEFVGDTRTFDTWMDSSVSALYITKYLSDKSFHGKTYPTQIRPQGKDIIRTWLHYSILRCWEITGKLPWSDVWITGWGLDERGEKMSKSKGNITEPLPLIRKYGAENFRLWAASEVSIGSDYVTSEQKIAGAGKFLTKLWNVARFISGIPRPSSEPGFEDLAPSDRWIMAELSELSAECLEGYRDYNFFIPANKIRDFTWNTFAAHYIELAKGRAYGQGFSEEEKISAQYALHECLRRLLLLLAPISPFITEKIWLGMYSEKSIHAELFPDYSNLSQDALKSGKALLEFNSKVWNEKKSKGLSLKEPVSILIPEELVAFSKDLKVMHNLN